MYRFYSSIEVLVMLFVSLAFLIGIFLLIRGLALWYWKIDKIVNTIEAQALQAERAIEKLEMLTQQGGRIIELLEGRKAGVEPGELPKQTQEPS